MAPRSHAVAEYRNVICGHIKRNDPVSRRFVQYINFQAGEVCILVRDAKTGRIVVQPPRERGGSSVRSMAWVVHHGMIGT